MFQLKNNPGLCAWCGSEDIEYKNLNPIFEGDFIKFKFKCNNCGKKSIEVFHLEFHKIEIEID